MGRAALTFLEYAFREEATLPRALISARANTLPPKTHFWLIRRLVKYENRMFQLSHVSPSEGSTFAGPPLDRPYVIEHNFE